MKTKGVKSETGYATSADVWATANLFRLDRVTRAELKLMREIECANRKRDKDGTVIRRTPNGTETRGIVRPSRSRERTRFAR